MDLNDFLPYRLSILSLKISNGIAEHYQQQFGINIAEWRILVILLKNPDINAKQIAHLSQMDKVRISRTIKSLLDKDYVTQKVDLNDGRARNYQLSSDGKKLTQAVIPAAIKYEQQLLAQLKPEERMQLQHLIRKLDRLTS